MAAEKISNNFAGRALAVGLAGLVAATPLAADEVTPASVEDACTSSVELCELRQAMFDAHEHGAQHGAAILLHAGADIQNHPQSEALLDWLEGQFQEKYQPYGVNIAIFPTNNDTAGSGVENIVGRSPYTPTGSDSPMMTIDVALSPEVVEQVARQAQLELERRLSQNTNLEVQPIPEG